MTHAGHMMHMLLKVSTCSKLKPLKMMLKCPASFNIALSGSRFKQVETFKLFGVITSHHLLWQPHIDSVGTSVLHNVHLMRRLSWFLPANSLKASILPTLLLALITTALSGTTVAPPTPPAFNSSKLCRSRCTQGPKSSSATKALSTLQWTSCSDR